MLSLYAPILLATQLSLFLRSHTLQRVAYISLGRRISIELADLELARPVAP